MSRTVQITLRANRTLGTASDSDALLTLTPLGLVISEHIDKISFFEPAIAVCDKTITPDAVTFGRTCAPDGTGLKGIRLDGHIYDVLKKDGRIIVSRDGELIAEEAGGVTLKR